MEETLLKLLQERNIDAYKILAQLPDEVADALLETLSNDNQLDLVLLLAVFKGNSPWVQRIIPYTTQQSHLAQCKSLNALQLATFVGHVQCAEIILERDEHRQSWLAATCEGFTPLHIAVHNKNLTLVKAFLAALENDTWRKSYLDQKSENLLRWTALHIAAMKDQADLVKCLVSKGADTEIGLQESNQTPLHVAALFKSTQAARMLISQRAQLTAVTDEGLTALELLTSNVPLALDAVNPMLDERIEVENLHADQRSMFIVDYNGLQMSASDLCPNLLSCFITADQKQFLQHPVCQLLLEENWKRFLPWIYARFLVCFAMLFCITVYMVAFHGIGCTIPVPT
jgi:hypothetical protein